MITPNRAALIARKQEHIDYLQGELVKLRLGIRKPGLTQSEITFLSSCIDRMIDDAAYTQAEIEAVRQMSDAELMAARLMGQ